MRIALIGTRGVPASYGGFETCVEEIGQRLVQRGHEVTVYCRSGHYREHPADYSGMRLVHLPNIRHKALDTLSHTALSVIHAVTRSFDVLMVFNSANGPTLILPRLLGRRIAINTDGLEWKRGKWGRVARRYYRFAEWLSALLANRIVADSRGIQDYYRERYGVESSYIAYGAFVNQSRRPELLRSLGLTPGDYFLQITRFEPENYPLLTLRAFQGLPTDKKLVLVGGVPYPSDYNRQIHREAGERVLLPGYIYDQDLLRELWCNCYAYVHGNEVGGRTLHCFRRWPIVVLCWPSMFPSVGTCWPIPDSIFPPNQKTCGKRWPGPWTIPSISALWARRPQRALASTIPGRR